jgi:hypothetical protein
MTIWPTRFSPSGLLEYPGTDHPARPLIGDTEKRDAVLSKIFELDGSGCRLELDHAENKIAGLSPDNFFDPRLLSF